MQAYRELAEQRRAKSSQFSAVQHTLLTKRKVKRRSELCLAEVQQLPEETVSYKAVGRMFIACPLPSIKQELTSMITKAEEDIAAAEPQEKYLEREIQAIDKDLEKLADEQDEKRQADK